jgi:hypothetical protein
MRVRDQALMQPQRHKSISFGARVISSHSQNIYLCLWYHPDRLCVLVVRVLGYRSGGTGSNLGTTRKSSGFGTGSTQPREYN